MIPSGKTLPMVFLLSVLLVLAGCMPQIQSNVPELEKKAEKFQRIALISPHVEISEVSAGGVEEERKDWSAEGRTNIEKAVKELMKEKDVKVQVVKPNKKNKKEIEEINNLYRAVAYSIYSHTFYMHQGNVNIFVDRVQNFDYSIGPVDKLLKRYKADALLIVYASDQVSTKGRKTLNVVKAINPFGQADYDVTSLVMGLTDSTGAVLWFRTYGASGNHDFRNEENTQALVKDVLDDYPRGRAEK
jgi:hypothetical protein